MSCNNESVTPVKCHDFDIKYLLKLKGYVYEVVNGKRKRASPVVVKDGVIVEIKERAIVEKIRI